MTPEDGSAEETPLSRRALRAQTGATATAPRIEPDETVAPADETVTPADETVTPADTDGDAGDGQPAEWATSATPASALSWVVVTDVAEGTESASFDAPSREDARGDILAGARLRPGILRPRVLIPVGFLVSLVAAYSAAALLWPLNAVTPTAQAITVETATAPAAEMDWPDRGSAAIGVSGVGVTSSTGDQVVIASLTKLVSSLMVLDRLPLQVGEQGPEFSFTYDDSVEYWAYRTSDQSALDVPVDGVLTEYQMLQGTLLGSANNYIDRLSDELWGSDEAFAAAARVWLDERGLEDVTVVNPSGFAEENRATPEALIALTERAMENPVIAEIVATERVDLPGAGTVVNTNGMLADEGVVGVKTGTLTDRWNLITAKDVTIGDSTVRLNAAVLGQQSNEQRLAETRALFEDVENALATQGPAVTAGTVVGEVTTEWGTTVDITTDADTSVVLWDGATAESTATLDLGEARESAEQVGMVTTTGPLGTAETSVSLTEDVEGPSPWWRLTHPLELFGLLDR
ncbi:MAG: D-alanyl-D-alanine carboxypeptidase family protein [Actinomycetota bacterium]